MCAVSGDTDKRTKEDDYEKAGPRCLELKRKTKGFYRKLERKSFWILGEAERHLDEKARKPTKEEDNKLPPSPLQMERERKKERTKTRNASEGKWS